MRFGLFCFVIIFLGAELFQWAGGQTTGSGDLPLPVILLAGIALAIASNRPTKAAAPSPQAPVPKAETPQPLETETHIPVSPIQPPKSVKVPLAQPAHGAVSFKIKKPFQAE